MNNQHVKALCHSVLAHSERLTPEQYNRKYYAEHKDWKKKYNAEYYASHKKYWQDYYKNYRKAYLDSDKLTVRDMAMLSQNPGRLQKEADDWSRTAKFAGEHGLDDTPTLRKLVADTQHMANVERDLYNIWKVMNEAQAAKNAANAQRSYAIGKQTLSTAGTPKKTLAGTIKSWGDSFGTNWKSGANSMISKGKSIVNGLRAKLGF